MFFIAAAPQVIVPDSKLIQHMNASNMVRLRTQFFAWLYSSPGCDYAGKMLCINILKYSRLGAIYLFGLVS